MQYDSSTCCFVHITVYYYDGTMIADATAIRKRAIPSLGLTTEPSTGFGVQYLESIILFLGYGLDQFAVGASLLFWIVFQIWFSTLCKFWHCMFILDNCIHGLLSKFLNSEAFWGNICLKKHPSQFGFFVCVKIKKISGNVLLFCTE